MQLEQLREESTINKLNQMPEISFLIPVFNEGDELIQAILNFRDKIKTQLNNSFEFILATDNNDALTREAMKFLHSSIGCKIFFLTSRIGKGGTLKNVLKFASGKVVVFLDADLPVPAHQVAEAIKIVLRDEASMVIGIRRSRTHGSMRKFLSASYNTLVRLLFRTGIKDHQAGFKVLKNSYALPLVLSCRTDGLAFDTELIVNAKRQGLSIKTFKVDWKEKRMKSSSNIIPFRAMLTMFIDLFILRLVTWTKSLKIQLSPIGRILDGNMNVVDTVYMTILSSNHPRILSTLRKLYLAIAFSH